MQYYTIKDVAKRTCLSVPTIRYYDKIGLFPGLGRTQGGIRQFTQEDICRIELICCLKNSGMPLKKIREFMLLGKGDSELEQRKEMLQEHRECILQQIKNLQCSLCTVEYKIEHYKDIQWF